MSNKHDDNCKWEEVYFSLYSQNDNSDDEQLTISNTGVEMNHTVYSGKEPVEYINFKFCPLCGCEL